MFSSQKFTMQDSVQYWLRRQRGRKNKVSQKIPREQFLDFCLQTQTERNDSLIVTHRGLHYLRKTSYVAGVWNKGKEKVTCNLSVQCLRKQSFTLENISKGKDVKEDWELIDWGWSFTAKQILGVIFKVYRLWRFLIMNRHE